MRLVGQCVSVQNTYDDLIKHIFLGLRFNISFSYLHFFGSFDAIYSRLRWQYRGAKRQLGDLQIFGAIFESFQQWLLGETGVKRKF